MRQVDDDNHWLTRSVTIRRLWIVFGLILIFIVGLQFFIEVKGSFPMARVFGFGAWFGFAACVTMVLLARAFGWLLKRPEAYYDDTQADPADAEVVDEQLHGKADPDDAGKHDA